MKYPTYMLLHTTGKSLATTLEGNFSDALHSHCVLHLKKNFKDKCKKTKNLGLNLKNITIINKNVIMDSL